jgi:hypothetical protein
VPSVFFGLFLLKASPGFWVGSTFLATCGLLGVMVLGAASSLGKRRQIWLGAALFGVGYMYSIRDGLLLITSEESATPVYEDPFLIVGHCLLALFAAGIGGFVAPLVSGMRREPAA